LSGIARCVTTVSACEEFENVLVENSVSARVCFTGKLGAWAAVFKLQMIASTNSNNGKGVVPLKSGKTR
jgi:hypothetical protein